MLAFDITDDGRGIDVAKVKQKAFERRLLSENQLDAATEKQLLEFLFQPGFSLAERVTDVSGRGVGMDVIRCTMQELKGRVDIRTELGQGTTLMLRIPADYYQQL